MRFWGRLKAAQIPTARGEGWYAWRTGLHYAWYNGILVDRPAAEVGDAALAAARHFFAPYDGAISWWLAPEVTVEPWRARLETEGLQYEANAPGMAIGLDTLAGGGRGAALGRLEIRAVTSAEELRAWCDVFVPGYGLPDAWTEDAYKIMCAAGWELPVRHYLGVLEGEPVGTASLLPGGGAAGVYNVATLPPYRGRGIGAALTLAALELGRELGYQVGVLQSSQQGYSVYKRLGFAEVCRIDLFSGKLSSSV